jgi:hypothetical protein
MCLCGDALKYAFGDSLSGKWDSSSTLSHGMIGLEFMRTSVVLISLLDIETTCWFCVLMGYGPFQKIALLDFPVDVSRSMTC